MPWIRERLPLGRGGAVVDGVLKAGARAQVRQAVAEVDFDRPELSLNFVSKNLEEAELEVLSKKVGVVVRLLLGVLGEEVDGGLGGGRLGGLEVRVGIEHLQV